MDANASSVLFISPMSPRHIGRLVLDEQPIPLLNAFAYSFTSIHLIMTPPPLFSFIFSLQLLHSLFLLFLRPCLNTYTVLSSSFSFLHHLVFNSTSFSFRSPYSPLSQSKPGIQHSLYYSHLTYSNAFSLWGEYRVLWFSSYLSSGLSKGVFQVWFPARTPKKKLGSLTLFKSFVLECMFDRQSMFLVLFPVLSVYHAPQAQGSYEQHFCQLQMAIPVSSSFISCFSVYSSLSKS